MILLGLLASLNLMADVNFYDLWQKGAIEHVVNPTCQQFIQSSKRIDWVIPELDAYKKPLEQMGLLNYTFYHYTSADLYPMFKSSGLKDILTYSMKTDKATDNVAGAGFYVAGDPFTSSAFGLYRYALRFNPKSIALQKKGADLVSKMAQETSLRSTCPIFIIQTLIYDTNGIDIVLFDTGKMWYVVYNDDILEYWSKSYSPSSYEELIIEDVMKTDGVQDIFPYVSEFTQSENLVSLRWLIKTGQSFFTTKNRGVKKIIEAMTSSPVISKILLINYLKTLEGSDLEKMLQFYRQKNIIPDESLLAVVKLEDASEDYIKLVSSIVKANPKVTQNWGAVFIQQAHYFIKNGALHVGNFMDNAPVGIPIENYLNFLEKIPAQYKAQALMSILRKEVNLFNGASTQARHNFFNTFMLNAPEDKVAPFVQLLKERNYNLRGAYNYLKAHELKNGKVFVDLIEKNQDSYF